MLGIVLFFLFFALLLYTVLGGADFGAGILELFSSKKNQEISRGVVYRVIGPVWEANHIWLIIVLVVLWVGFPIYFNVVSIYLHIPLSLILLGITIRGVAFVFRHYDAVKDNTQYVYNFLFRLGSVITPVFLGMTFSAIVYGKIEVFEDPIVLANQSFSSVFIAPWLNVFTIAAGIFFAALCAFLAATFLVGETIGSIRKVYTVKAIKALFVVFMAGAIVLLVGIFERNEAIFAVMKNPISIGAFAISFLSLYPMWRAFRNQRFILIRTLAVFQVVVILFAALFPLFPEVLQTSTGGISIIEGSAPDAVISYLAVALIIGGSIILPGLYHLLKAFKMIKIFKD